MGGQPVYATPVRVIGQSGTAGNSATLGGHEGSYEHQQIPYPDYGAPSVRSAGRSLKGKPQNSTLGTTTRQANQMSGHHSLHYPSYAMVKIDKNKITVYLNFLYLYRNLHPIRTTKLSFLLVN